MEAELLSSRGPATRTGTRAIVPKVKVFNHLTFSRNTSYLIIYFLCFWKIFSFFEGVMLPMIFRPLHFTNIRSYTICRSIFETLVVRYVNKLEPIKYPISFVTALMLFIRKIKKSVLLLFFLFSISITLH